MPKINLNNTPNAQMIKNVQEKSVITANAKTVQDIPLELIDENPDNSSVFNMEDINKLAQNIKEEGFFGTIEVYQKPNGRYEISSGHRRFRAMQQLNAKTIPATVSALPELNTKIRRKLIASNINSRNMTPLDWARAIQYYADTLILEDAQRRGKEIKADKRYKSEINVLDELSRYFDLSIPQIVRYQKLNKLIPELTQLVEDKKVPWSALCQAGSLSEELQKQVYKDLNQLLTVSRYSNPKEQIENPEDEEEQVIALAGSQVNKIIERYTEKKNKGNIEQSKTIVPRITAEREEQNYQSSDVILDNEIDIPTYTGEVYKTTSNEETIKLQEPVYYIDDIIFSEVRELSFSVKKNYSIKNKKKVKEQIDLIKTLLENIEKRL